MKYTFKHLAWMAAAIIAVFALFGPHSVVWGQNEVEETAEEVVEEVTEAAEEVGQAMEGEEAGNEEAAEEEEADPLQGAPDDAAFATYTANNVWMMVAAFLVFIMHLGFASLESGLCQSKNTVNILAKNTFIIAMGIITYWIFGFAAMYPGFADGTGGEIFGVNVKNLFYTAGDADQSYGYVGGGYPGYTDFLFQAMFAATAATIVSGAVAERIKLIPFMIFTTLFVGICYPILGSWKWGYGWLHDMDFYDFAGSTLVHSVGGWGALAGVILLGARNGKYVDGKPRFLPMSNLPLATIGVFLLWLGWFGFNGGSVLSADPNLTSLTLVTTNLAASAGVIAGLFTAWFVYKRADLSFALNGALAGLVGITAGADSVTPGEALFIGLIAGVIVVFSVMMLDNLKLDDPVGAISVHLTCGIWGTLAAGIFGGYNVGVQAIGVLAYGAAAFAFAFVVFLILKVTMGIRVSPEEEAEGLDKGEHHLIAYDMPEKLA